MEQIFFKLSLKTTLGDVRTQNNLDLEIFKKKKSALLGLKNDCSSCHFCLKTFCGLVFMIQPTTICLFWLANIFLRQTVRQPQTHKLSHLAKYCAECFF